MTDPQDLPRLTPKQEGWLEDYQASGNASEAYRKHYSTDNMKSATVNRNAHALLNNSKIQTILEQRKTDKDQKRMEIEEIARKHATEALQTLVSISSDPKAPTSSRVAAAGAVLDRAHGKPISKTELDATLSKASGGADELSDDELMAMLSAKGEG
ncbi:MAG: terminase small subunit [Desulfobacteraceae bacterium]|nr:terminase small subunit [Desulfobacteraceae bacterium]